MIVSQSLQFIHFLGGTWQLLNQVLRVCFSKPIHLNLLIEQIYQVGVRSLPLVLIVSGSTGMVIALQFGIGLEKFGGKLYVPKIASLSIARELGPVLGCLMLAARVGAGITSEIGSMKVTQQLDAIRALGTSPLEKIVVPRVLGCFIAIPLISVFSIIIGILGGLIVGNFDLNLDYLFYFQKVITTIQWNDFFSGVGKTFFFALFISITACYYGLKVEGGTQGVGLATTKSVVTSSIFIMGGDYILTKFFLIFERML